MKKAVSGDPQLGYK